jgi:hypothetical protein
MTDTPSVAITAGEAQHDVTAAANAEAGLEYWRQQHDKVWIFSEPITRLDIRRAGPGAGYVEIVLARHTETGELRCYLDGVYQPGRYAKWVIDLGAALAWRGGHWTPGYESPDEPMIVVRDFGTELAAVKGE